MQFNVIYFIDVTVLCLRLEMAWTATTNSISNALSVIQLSSGFTFRYGHTIINMREHIIISLQGHVIRNLSGRIITQLIHLNLNAYCFYLPIVIILFFRIMFVFRAILGILSCIVLDYFVSCIFRDRVSCRFICT